MEKLQLPVNGFNQCYPTWDFSMDINPDDLNSSAAMDTFFNSPPNWDTPTDQNELLESALSSIVSSPTAAGDTAMLTGLIGRLGTVCNSTITSCHTTPLNSLPNPNPRSGTLPNHQHPGLPPLHADPGINEPKLNSGGLGGSREGSSVSEQNPPAKLQSVANRSPKRKSNPRVKGNDTTSPALSKLVKVDGWNSRKRSRAQEAVKKGSKNAKGIRVLHGNADIATYSEVDEKTNKEMVRQPPEPPKDYIHVRARRGQATDTHSLAERVRREKISKRMKFLQELVPGCSKVTGKAVVLDEIINYVQSLQQQVEFLSLKLAALHPWMGFDTDTLGSKDHIFHRGGALTRPTTYTLDDLAQGLRYAFQAQQMMMQNFTSNASFYALNAMHIGSHGHQLPYTDEVKGQSK